MCSSLLATINKSESESSLLQVKSSIRSLLNDRRNRSQEAVATLLSYFGPSVEACSEEFDRQEIRFKDLSALCDEDLQLLGIKDADRRKEMLETFALLPNQTMHFDRYILL